MRWLSAALLALVILLQYPLWIGKGGWLRVWAVNQQLDEQKEANKKLEIRNAGMNAEVIDLKQGYDAIEERARFDLGMIRQDEVFVQIPDQRAAAQTTSSAPPPPTPIKPPASQAKPKKAPPKKTAPKKQPKKRTE